MNDKLKGIIPRMISGIFDYISNAVHEIEFIVKISMLEIYMEEARDLLNPNSDTKLKIRESPTEGIFIENLVEKCVEEELEVEQILSIGNNNRKIGRTNMNEVSSRSHALTVMSIS